MVDLQEGEGNAPWCVDGPWGQGVMVMDLAYCLLLRVANNQVTPRNPAPSAQGQGQPTWGPQDWIVLQYMGNAVQLPELPSRQGNISNFLIPFRLVLLIQRTPKGEPELLLRRRRIGSSPVVLMAVRGEEAR